MKSIKLIIITVMTTLFLAACANNRTTADSDTTSELFWDASQYNLSDDKLDLDTVALMKEIVDSEFMDSVEMSYLFSSSRTKAEKKDGTIVGVIKPSFTYDFNSFNGFKELMSRKDLLKVLETYVKQISDGAGELAELGRMAFYEILKQEEVVALVEKAEAKGEELPCLYEWYNTSYFRMLDD